MRTILFFAWPVFDAPELGFWTRLRDALAGRGFRLVLASAEPPPPGLGVDHVLVPRRLDATFPSGASPLGGIPAAAIGLDEGALLRREGDWGEPGIVPVVDVQRRRAIGHIIAHWASILTWLKPAVTVIWNGQHPPEMMLDALCRLGGCPVLYAERAPIPRALFVDDRGLSASSAVAALRDWTVEDVDRWAAVADRVSSRVAQGHLTWWEQPACRATSQLRTDLGVGPKQRLVLFAGQVDEDTQQFLFSPHFTSNLAAFAWWLRQVQGRTDVFVLGKHHPRSGVSVDAYRRVLSASGVPGVWLDDIAIDDALDACDRVVAVNSTVLYEALARQIPALVLGHWLMSGRGAATEVDRLDDGPHVVARWLDGDDAEPQQVRWRAALGFLLERSLYAYEPAPVTGGMRGADDLARRLEASADGGAEWTVPPALVEAALRGNRDRREPWWVPWDATWIADHVASLEAGAEEWQRWQWLRDIVKQGRQAVRDGRRLVIWGTGAAGRHAAELLARAGVETYSFGSSTPPATPSVQGRRVLAPVDLRCGTDGGGDYVLIATAARTEVSAMLESLGFREAVDYRAFDVDELLAAALAYTDMTGTAAAVAGDRRKD